MYFYYVEEFESGKSGIWNETEEQALVNDSIPLRDNLVWHQS